MEAILFMGIQASGKSSFYKERFFDTHVRISLDLLNTRNSESKLLQTCLELQKKVVIDNTNPTKADRARYIPLFQDRGYTIIGYYFQSKLDTALKQNAARSGKKRIPDLGLMATYKKLELPSFSEGFDQLHYVLLEQGQFIVQNWKNEV